LKIAIFEFLLFTFEFEKMEELVQQLKEKAGLSNEQALAAIQVMKGYIHGKVPPMFAGFVDNFFADNNATGSTDSFLH